MGFPHAIDDLAGLRILYADPNPLVAAKAIDHIDEKSHEFLGLSPFAVLATAGPHGTDASPRGGPPGFAAVLDERRLALGDLAGNRRLDSFENMLANPAVGLLFMVPGMGETLRINGRATLTTDPDVLEACAFPGTRPTLALGIDIDEVFLHCPKAFRRSKLWDPASWPSEDGRPSAGAIFCSQLDLDMRPEAVDAALEEGYATSMWQAGGEDAPVR
jgi:uncharacterized protein